MNKAKHCLLVLLTSLAAQAQVLYTPAAASTRLYFAQLVDGGPSAGKWATTLIFTNPGNVAASVSVSFYGDNGQPLALDFGTGARSTLTFTLAAGGAATYTTAGSETVNPVVGWGVATSDMAILGTVLFQSSRHPPTPRSAARSQARWWR